MFNQLPGVAKVVIDARSGLEIKTTKELAQPVGGVLMKARVVFAAMLLMISIPSGSATVRISDDHGGRIRGLIWPSTKLFGCPANGWQLMVSARRHAR